MTHNDINCWPRRQAAIKIEDIEPTSLPHTGANRQLPRLRDGRLRDIDSPHIQPSTGKPYADHPGATSEIESFPARWEQVLIWREHFGQFYRRDVRCRAASVALLPANAILLAHTGEGTQ